MTRKRFFANAATAVGLVAALLLLTQVAGHSHVSSGRWDADDIPVRMHLGNLSTAWRNAAIDGLRAWNAAGSRFSFSWSSTSRAAVNCERYDGTNSVIWSDRQCSSGRWLAWDDNLLAKTHLWTLRSTGAIVDADVMFNNAKRWSIYNGRLRRSRGDTVWDFRRVATHEFGHVLGLDHPDDHGQVRPALMNSETSDIDTLQPDDVNGVRGLYGSDPGRGSPDLVVRSLRVDDRTLTPGQVFSLSATIANEGTGRSAATTLRYYYWRASAREWTVIGFDSVTSLAPSASAGELIRLRASSTTGTHYYTGCVQAVTGETNRRNCARSSVRVTVSEDAGEAPDLVVQNLGVSARSVVAGQDFTFTATVRNVGSGTAEATTLRLYSRAESGSWTRIGNTDVRSLAAGASTPVSTTLRAPTNPGTYSYTACVASVTGETNTRNCGSSVRVTVTAGPAGGAGADLVVVSPRIREHGLMPGDDFTFSVEVRNIGTAPSEEGVPLVYYMEWAGSTVRNLEGRDVVPVLSPSTRSSHSIRLRVPSFENPRFYACVQFNPPDPFTALVESCSDPVEVFADGGTGNECVTDLGTVTVGTVVREGQLTARCESSNRGGSYSRYYNFTLTQQAWVTIDLTSPRVDPYVYLLEGAGTGGNLLARNDDSGPGLDARISDQGLSPGVYTIEATTSLSNRTGPFTLELAVSEAVTPVGGQGGPGVSNTVPEVTFRGSPANKEIGIVNIDTGGQVGDTVAVSVGARDHACEDGDRVELQVFDGSSWTTVFNGEIFNHWQDRTFSATVGNHYTVIAIALNGTGFKGPCSYRDANSGEMRVRHGGLSRTTSWRAPGGSASVGVINVTP